MGFLKTYSLTKITGAFILLAVVFTIVSQEKWNKDNAVISSDVRGYYAYLPALFIHNDLKFENHEVYKIEKGYEVWVMKDKNGKKYIKFTCGMSILYTPFFLVSHALAEPLGEKADGFSSPYKIGLIVSSIFYLFISILFLSKFLLLYFEDRTVSICLLILFLGTNLFEFETGLLTQSHAYSFALLTVFMYSSVKWLDTPRFKWAIWMGITGGLMFLIRPIDVLFLSFILLFNVNSFKDLIGRFKLIWNYKKQAFVFLGLLLLMISPQLLYFKHIFGSFIYYSYTKEGFFFLHPHLFDSVFSYRNGWLVYSPIMLLSLIGFFFIKRYSKQFTWFSPFAFLMYFYVISSWWCWWYVGFGNRAFINLYPILAVPLCAFISFALSKKIAVRVGLNVLVLTFIVFNGFQTYQYEKRIIHWGWMSKDSYWDSFGRTEHSQLAGLYFEPPDLEKALLGRDVVNVSTIDTLYSSRNGFEKLNPESSYFPFVQKKEFFKGNKALFFGGQPFAMQKTFNVPKGTNSVYISAWVKTDSELRIVLTGEGEVPFYKASDQIEKSQGGWKKLHLLAKLPKELTYENLKYYIWNHEKGSYQIDNIELHCFAISVEYIER
ncbi:MAG: hypothetical protein ACJA0U_001480 [Salibacteraceae bacterium]|jgi:hypothetical protein